MLQAAKALPQLAVRASLFALMLVLLMGAVGKLAANLAGPRSWYHISAQQLQQLQACLPAGRKLPITAGSKLLLIHVCTMLAYVYKKQPPVALLCGFGYLWVLRGVVLGLGQLFLLYGSKLGSAASHVNAWYARITGVVFCVSYMYIVLWQPANADALLALWLPPFLEASSSYMWEEAWM